MKKRNNFIIYTTICFFGIAAVIIGILYFSTDIFKSNQQLFYKYLGKSEIIDKDFINKYNVINNNLYNKNISSNMKVKMLNSKMNQETQVSDIQEVFTMNSKSLKNALLNQSYRDFIFSNNNQTFLTIKTLKDNNTYGIIADNILGKYLAVDNSNLKDLFSKLKITNTDVFPDSIVDDYIDLFVGDSNILRELKEKYFNLIYENIKKENYYKIKNENKTEVFGILISEQEVFDIIRLMLDTIKEDDMLLDLISNKLQLLNYNNINKENIQTELQKHIDKINNNTYTTDTDYLNIFLTIKEEKVLSIELEIRYKEENITNQENTTNNEIEKSFKLNLEEDNKIQFEVRENNLEVFDIIFNYIYDNEKINLYTEINVYKNKEKQSFKIQYQISNYQTDNIEHVAVIDMILSNIKFQIEINNNIAIKDDVQISKLTTENSVKINEMTPEELELIKNALLNRINELYNIDLRKKYNSITEEYR